MRQTYFLALAILALSCAGPISNERSEKGDVVDLNYYNEEHRPQFHFSPETMWMNDPNGMVFYEGEYHLFYQYHPSSTVWGPMHWGHAISKDLVHWEHLPIALYPDSLGYIFSGSAVIDWNNTSGFGSKENPPMIAIFTHHNTQGEKSGRNDYQVQSIAYSLDKGRSWTKYENNPIVENPGMKDFRDPKVIWDKVNDQWVMVFAAYDENRFYVSNDLKSWEYTSSFGIEGDDRLWECPDFFPLQAKNEDEMKWILITSIQKEAPNGGTGTSYFIGDWDGKKFIPEGTQKWLDYGTDNYAFVTWSDVPETDGRRIGLGWMSNWQYAQSVPTEKWRSAMTLPRSLELVKVGENYALQALPVIELEKIEDGRVVLEPGKITETVTLQDSTHHLTKLSLSFRKPDSGLIQLRFSNNESEELNVGFQAGEEAYFIDRTFAGKSDFSDVFADYHTAPVDYESDKVEMLIYLDRSSIEIFADGGKMAITDIFFPSSPFTKMELVADNNDMELLGGELVNLKSIWR